MPISPYLAGLRSRVGHDLILVPAVAAVIRDDTGHVLIGKIPGRSLWNLPSGHIDPGESPAQAVIREVSEETGLDVRPTRVLAVLGGLDFRHQYPNQDRVEATIIAFACEALGGTLHPRDGELEALRYADPEALPAMAAPWPAALFDDLEGCWFSTC